MSLVADILESAGIVTVVVGSARDIVEEAGVARFVFSDVPLGGPFGAPNNPTTQIQTLRLALDMAVTAKAPRSTVQSAARWHTEDWRHNYMLVDDSNRAALALAGEKRRARQRNHMPRT